MNITLKFINVLLDYMFMIITNQLFGAAEINQYRFEIVLYHDVTGFNIIMIITNGMQVF